MIKNFSFLLLTILNVNHCDLSLAITTVTYES